MSRSLMKVILVLAFSPVAVLSGEIGTGCVDGIDCSPPMGWRSWNTFGGDVSQDLMINVMDAMTDTSRDGVSFASLGYSDVGLDDNYQSCGEGVNGTFHEWSDEIGGYVNLIRQDTFPDMLSMTTYGHNLGLTVGFYENNCICSESDNENYSTDEQSLNHYIGDVSDMVTYGYDSVKLDGCGSFLNLTLYQELLNNTGKYYLIENCHWGGTIPTLDWCPWSYFRTSGDISKSWSSMFNNLQTMIPYQDMQQPLSRPGCWAYPDMLEVGNLANYIEDRSHFGAWCITSAPLILGHNITDQAANDAIWEIVNNTEAIAINQGWYNHPGYLVSSYDPTTMDDDDDVVYAVAQDCSSSSSLPSQEFKIDTEKNLVIRISDGFVLDYSKSTSELILAEEGSSNYQSFIYQPSTPTTNNNDDDGSKGGSGPLIASNCYQNSDNCNCGDWGDICCLDIYNSEGPVVQLYPCNYGTNENFYINNKTNSLQDIDNKCIIGSDQDPINSDNLIQIWAKPISENEIAVFIISNVNDDDGDSYEVKINFNELSSSFTSETTMNIRDVWNHIDIDGPFYSAYTTPSLAPHDSFFYIMTSVV